MIYLTDNIIKAINTDIMDSKHRRSLVQYPAGLSLVVTQPQMKFFGQDRYPDCYTKAAYLLQKITKKHIFEDGNKRTALLSMMLFLKLNGYQFEMPSDTTIQMMVLVTKANDDDTIMYLLAHKLKKYSHKIR